MTKGFAISVAAAASVAVLGVRAELPNWTVTWTNDAQTVGLCSNDQNSFVLNVYRDADSAHGGFGLAIGLKDATKGSSVASVDGLGYLDLRGPISGLDPRVDPATNAVWKYSRFTDLCFSPNNGTNTWQGLVPAQYITGLHSPGTLVANTTLNVFHIDSGKNPKNTKEYILDEPNVTTRLGGWDLNAVGGLTNLVFRVPKVTKLGGGPLCHMATGWKTDVGKEWDLSGVETVGDAGANNVLGIGTVPGMIGILRLPALKVINATATSESCAAFRGIGIGEAELGLNGNLQRLDPCSFRNCNSLTNVVIGASPAGSTLTINSKAFTCNNLKTVYFDGEKPVFGGETDSVVFGTTAAEGYMTFYVRDIPSWADVLAEADANGGFVSAATMRTANRQRVVRYSGFHKVSVELQDPRFADIYHETVTVTWTDGREGDYHYGPVTLTATCSDPDDAATDPRRAKFLRWDGVPVELERQNPLTFTPTKNLTVKAVFAHDWLMSDDEEPNRVMENRFWRLCCWKRDAASHAVGLGKNANAGKGSMWPSDSAQRMGGGDLNLNGDIWDSAGQKWTMTSVAGMAVWYVNNKCPSTTAVKDAGELEKLPTRLTLPETLLYWPSEIQNYDSWDNGAGAPHWPIEEVIAICPNATGNINGFTIGGCCYLKRLVIRAPKLTSFSGVGTYGFTWTGASFSGSNFDEWDLTGITSIPDNAFHGATDYAIPGTLRFPNVQTVGSNAFSRLSKMTGLELSPTNRTLKSLGNFACGGLKGLETLTIGTCGLALGSGLPPEKVFEGMSKLKTLRFSGRALPQATIDAILTSVPESATTKQVTIYASPFNHWDELAAALTDEEKAVKPADCFGVYRDGLRKAWFVSERSPFEPKGTLIILK